MIPKLQTAFAPIILQPDATTVIPNYLEYVLHPLATEAAKHKMTVEQYLEYLEKQKEGNGVIFQDTGSDALNYYKAQLGSDPETNKKEQTRQAKGEAKAKEKAANTVGALLEMGLPSTYIGMATGAIYPDADPIAHNIWNDSRMILDAVLGIPIGGLVKLGMKTATKKLVNQDIKNIKDLEFPLFPSNPDLINGHSKFGSNGAQISIDLLGFPKDANYQPYKKLKQIKIPYLSTQKSLLGKNIILDKAAIGYSIGSVNPAKYTQWYVSNEMPRRIQALGHNPDKLVQVTLKGIEREFQVPFRDVLIQDGTLPVELFYSDDLPSGIVGQHLYGKHISRARIDPSYSPANIKSTIFHEGAMHGTDDVVFDMTNGQVELLYADVAKDAYTVNTKSSQKWEELRATLGEAYRTLCMKISKAYNGKLPFEQVNTVALNAIDKMDANTLSVLLEDINGYGLDYSLTVLDKPEFAKKIKWLLKNAPVAATPISVATIPSEKHGGKLNYLNYAK